MNPEELGQLTFNELQGLALKARQYAKATRKEWMNMEDSEERDSQFRSVIEELARVISTFNERLLKADPNSLEVRDLCTEIADCYGVQGGTYRDWERFLDAARAYAKGRECERRVEDLGGQPNSYCLVQRLVNLILADPEAFSKQSPIDDVDVRRELELAREAIREQMRAARKDDPWAQADLGLIRELLDDDAVSEWDKLDDLNPKQFVRDATADVVRSLAERLTPYLSEGRSETLKNLVKRLTWYHT